MNNNFPIETLMTGKVITFRLKGSHIAKKTNQSINPQLFLLGNTFFHNSVHFFFPPSLHHRFICGNICRSGLQWSFLSRGEEQTKQTTRSTLVPVFASMSPGPRFCFFLWDRCGVPVLAALFSVFMHGSIVCFSAKVIPVKNVLPLIHLIIVSWIILSLNEMTNGCHISGEESVVLFDCLWGLDIWSVYYLKK